MPSVYDGRSLGWMGHGLAVGAGAYVLTNRERQWLDDVAGMNCIICEDFLQIPETPATVHHQRTGYGTSQRAPYYRTLPLCPLHHQTGGRGVAFHAGQEEWEAEFDLEVNLIVQVQQRMEMKGHKFDVYVIKDGEESKAYTHKGNGLSCPHCGLGCIWSQVGYRCVECHATVTEVRWIPK